MSEKTIDHKRRAHAVLSASSSARWLACPPSAVAAEAYPKQDTAFTQEGTLAHEVAELMMNPPGGICLESFKKWTGSDDVTAEMCLNAEKYRDYIWELTKSPDALVLLEQRVDFSAWVPDGFGTADCIIIQGQTMDVIDYKYGQGVEVSAERNPQMMLYGLGAWNDYGFAYDIEKVRLHIFQPRIDNVSVYELSADDLLAWGETVIPVAGLAAKGKGEYKPGSHCKFCPHAGRCQALSKVCSTIVKTHGLRVRVPVLPPPEVAEILQMEPLIALWLKRVKDQALTDMLNGEQIPGYKVVEGRLGNRKWTNEVEAYKSLIANGCTADEITETKLLSPSAMEKAFGKKRAAELLEIGGVERASGAPTIAPENDKRQPYDRLAEVQKDFQ